MLLLWFCVSDVCRNTVFTCSRKYFCTVLIEATTCWREKASINVYQSVTCSSLRKTTHRLYQLAVYVSLPRISRMRRNMSNLGMCLVIICGGIQIATSVSCPLGYACKWEDGIYVLNCSPSVDDYTLQIVNSIIDDIPTNATRVKIKCFKKSIVIRVRFSGLPNVRELTLDTFTVPSDYGQMFQGITDLSTLTLRNLKWSNMTNSTFDGLSKLRYLFVENLDDLAYMDADVLVALESLESLSFRHVGANKDRLRYSHYAAILRNLPPFNLHTLVMYAVHSETHDETKLNIDTLFNDGLSSWRLRYLDMGRNNIVFVDGNPARSWPALEYISFAENTFLGGIELTSFWVQFYTHRTLKTIDLSMINQQALDSGDAVFHLSVDNVCHLRVPITLGPRVESISLRDTILIADTKTRIYPVCFRDSNDTVHYVDLANGRSTKPLSFSLVNLRMLQYLNLQNLNTHVLTEQLFSNMVNLTMLLLGQNPIGGSIANDSENALFSNSTTLRMLDLAECQITTVPAEEFSHLHQLEILNLSRNDISTFTAKLERLTSLRLLNISHNRLTTLSPTTTKELDRMASQRTVQVDISGNPLLCFADQSEFVTWAKTTRVQFVNAENTFCTGENGTELLYFGDGTIPEEGGPEITEIKNSNDGWKYGIGISLSLIGIAIPIAVFIWCRCRWKFALYCHHMKKGKSTDDATNLQSFKRDAFICYNSEDSSWVCQELLHRLEDCQISTVIHHRDFLPGSVLEETIRESIDMSRYTVLVLSPDFLSSNWCLLEMHLARYRIISEGRDVIVPIILREFPASLLTRTLEGILSKSYLEWTDDPEGQALFWDKLVTKLKQGGNIRPLDN